MYKWFLSYLLKHRLQVGLVLVFALLEPVLYVYPMILSSSVLVTLLEEGTTAAVWVILRYLLPLALLQFVIHFTNSFSNEVLAHRITTDMTEELFASLSHRSLTYHDRKNVGEIMARATTDTRAVNIALSPGIRMILSQVAIWCLVLYFLWTVRPLWVPPVIGMLLVYSGAVVMYARSITPISNRVLEQLSVLSQQVYDTLQGIKDLKSYVAESLLLSKFKTEVIKHAVLKQREGVIGAWFYPQVLVYLTVFSIMGAAIRETVEGTLSREMLLLFLLFFGLAAALSQDLEWVAFVLAGGNAALRRLSLLLNEVDPAPDETGEECDLSPDEPIKEIVFEKVYFRYQEDREWALEGLSFKLTAPETLAIIGSPGSGKSTIAKLIQRLYLPQKGRILINGKDIRAISPASLRQKIATVEQEIFLFNDTVLENIRFGKPQATLAEVKAAARLAHATEFIEQLSNGYQTLIGENGVKLSGGQAQRIAFARALLLDPSLLIIDDGASALDAKTELAIQESIKEILRVKTTIITTHRLAIIAQADKILILEKGKLVGLGSHEELIRSNHFYRRLFERHYELPPYEPLASREDEQRR